MTVRLPFSIDEYRSRLSRVQARLTEHGIELLLITTPENNYYLTGHDSLSAAMVRALERIGLRT
jgi:Xaa-Pro aminopeptidase